MAQLSPSEFRELTAELIEKHGLSRLQEKLTRANVVVSRRSIATPDSIARSLHGLTAGLAREGIATQVVLALWEEGFGSELDEDTNRALEETAARINELLGPDLEPVAGREADLDRVLGEYRERLADRIGARAAELTMLTRAVPAVARRLRAAPSSARDT